MKKSEIQVEEALKIVTGLFFKSIGDMPPTTLLKWLESNIDQDADSDYPDGVILAPSFDGWWPCNVATVAIDLYYQILAFPDSVTSSAGKQITTIQGCEIRFWFADDDTEMSDSSIEHVAYQLCQGMREGELSQFKNAEGSTVDEVVNGWWEIW